MEAFLRCTVILRSPLQQFKCLSQESRLKSEVLTHFLCASEFGHNKFYDSDFFFFQKVNYTFFFFWNT